MENPSIKIITTEKELADVKEIRRKVFQEEQKIDASLDFDGKDSEADHVIVYLKNEPIGTARVRYIDKENKTAKVERVAILEGYRNLKIGKMIMEYLHNFLEEKGIEESRLESQEHAKGFYEKFGYEQKGEIFEEAGIPHVKMEKKFNLKIK